MAQSVVRPEDRTARVVLFTGKGGVGKTTTAAATALHAARSGVSTLVVSLDPAGSLADVLGVRLGPEPIRLAPGLSGQQVDPRSRAERSGPVIQPHLAAALDDLDVGPLAVEELAELPGTGEVLSLLELRDQVGAGRWELVVVDCPPATETLRLLAAPEVLARGLERLLPMERRIARIVALDRPGRGRSPGPGRLGAEAHRDRLVEVADALGAELTAVQRVLRSPSTSIRLVLTAESVVLAETRRTWTALALHGFAVDAVVANRLVEGGSQDGREQQQARVLDQARTSFSPIPVQRSGYAETEPVGLPALSELAEALYGLAGAQAAAELLAAPSGAEEFAVLRDDGGFVFRLPVPLADRRDLDLGRRGDDLVVTVQGRRRVLTLPSALRRCQVDGATLRDGALSVRFVPDPAQWRSL